MYMRFPLKSCIHHNRKGDSLLLKDADMYRSRQICTMYSAFKLITAFECAKIHQCVNNPVIFGTLALRPCPLAEWGFRRNALHLSLCPFSIESPS